MASRTIGLMLLAVVAASLVWIAAEQHYQSCVDSRFVTGAGGPFRFDDEPDPLSHASIKGCKRSPF